MKALRFSLLFTFYILCNFANAQAFQFTKMNSKKTVKLEAGRNIVVYYHDLTDSTDFTTYKHNFHGKLVAINDSNLIIDIERDHYTIAKTDTILS